MDGQKTSKLNIGCGKFKKEGYTNVDGYAGFNPDVLHDLDNMPYPFADDTYDLVEADHVLEHLKQPFHALRELYRITKDGGTMIIRVPHFSRGFSHPEHRNGFDVSLPSYFDPKFSARYEDDIVMECISMRMHWAAQPYVKKIALSPFIYYPYFAVGKVIDFLANHLFISSRLSTFIASRIWCFWVGGFEEIEYVFSPKKK